MTRIVNDGSFWKERRQRAEKPEARPEKRVPDGTEAHSRPADNPFFYRANPRVKTAHY